MAFPYCITLLLVVVGQLHVGGVQAQHAAPGNTESPELCKEWASFGECERNPEFMRESCALACREHDEVAAAERARKEADERQREEEAAMAEAAAAASAQIPAESATEEEEAAHCAEWARFGECERNPGYMKESCAKACREHAMAQDASAPVEPQHPSVLDAQAASAPAEPQQPSVVDAQATSPPAEPEQPTVADVQAPNPPAEPEQSAVADVQASSPCHVKDYKWLPLNMEGQDQSEVADAFACQRLCASVAGCAHFSFWADFPTRGRCHLQDEEANSAFDGSGVVSGSPSCPGAVPGADAQVGVDNFPQVPDELRDEETPPADSDFAPEQSKEESEVPADSPVTPQSEADVLGLMKMAGQYVLEFADVALKSSLSALGLENWTLVAASCLCISLLVAVCFWKSASKRTKKALSCYFHTLKCRSIQEGAFVPMPDGNWAVISEKV